MIQPQSYFRFLSIMVLLICALFSKAQVLYDTGQIANEITGIINAIPTDTAGDDFVPPGALQLATFNQALNLIHSGNYAQAADSINTLDYSLTLYYDTGEVVKTNLVFLQNAGSNYWGTYIFNPNYCKPLVIQSPHPKFDFNTGKQGIYVFRKTEAYAFMMSGTHRCNSSVYTTCSGSTDVCAAVSEDYRISDMAHYDTSLFHQATRNIFDQFNNTVFIQLHGFTKGGSDPYVIMSNGTRFTPGTDYLDTLDGALYAQDSVLTFKLVHVDLAWTKLTGLTNVQGRYINQSGNPCTSNPVSVSGRFLHLEQEKDRLRANSTGWAKMANALNSVFTCAALPVQLLSFTGVNRNGEAFIRWTTASEHQNDKFDLQKLGLDGKWKTIFTVQGGGNSNTVLHYSYVDTDLPKGEIYYRLMQTDFDGNTRLSGTLMLEEREDETFKIYPNPADKEVKFNFEQEGDVLVKIFDAGGRMVELTTLHTGENVMDLSALQPGFYFVQAIQGRTTLSRKFMIHR